LSKRRERQAKGEYRDPLQLQLQHLQSPQKKLSVPKSRAERLQLGAQSRTCLLLEKAMRLPISELRSAQTFGGRKCL
jgi:hypothetical protein